MPKLSSPKSEVDSWRVLRVFANEVRVAVVRLLAQFEWRSLSEIAEKLESDYGWKMTLPGLLKHMKELEDAGIVHHESGVFAKVSDARKTIYTLQGKERVEKILKQLEDNVANPLEAGLIFSETAKLAREVEGVGATVTTEGQRHLESLLAKCESQKISGYLTEDEKKKVKLWRMMLKIMKE
ncbi:MAG: winged helix-turn-helix domain-containing protein [Candidatus Bathyarchaeia archaeon]